MEVAPEQKDTPANMGASLRRRQRSRSGASGHEEPSVHPVPGAAEHRRRHGSQQHQLRKSRLVSSSSNGHPGRRSNLHSVKGEEEEDDDEESGSETGSSHRRGQRGARKKNLRINVKKLKEDEISHYSGTNTDRDDEDEVEEEEGELDVDDDDDNTGTSEDEEAVVPPPKGQRGSGRSASRPSRETGGGRARRSSRTAPAAKAEPLSVRQRRSSREQQKQQEKTRRGPRSELAKLLEAGASSFHCESAKEASSRVTASSNGLGPIHVEVSSSTMDSIGFQDFAYRFA